MARPRTCTVQIALDIKKYGLPAVRDAVAMAIALSGDTADANAAWYAVIKPKRQAKAAAPSTE